MPIIAKMKSLLQVVRIFIMNIYRKSDTLYLTLIDAELVGDTFFPDYTKYNWQEMQRIENPADDKNPYALTFLKLERMKDKML